MKRSWLLYPAVTAAGIAADLVSKEIIFAAWPPRTRGITVVDGFFNIVCQYNDKFAFSLGPDDKTIVAILHVGAFAAIGYLLYHLRDSGLFVKLALSLILAGAIGNLYDRLTLAKVRDFLDFHVGNRHWPTFNLADSMVSVGATIIIVTLMFARKKGATGTKGAADHGS